MLRGIQINLLTLLYARHRRAYALGRFSTTLENLVGLASARELDIAKEFARHRA